MTTRSANRAAPHTALLRTIEEYLQVRGGYTLRIMAGLGQRRGSPDLVCCLNGRMIAIDAKTGDAKMSYEQVTQWEQIIAAGGLFIVARSVYDVEQALLDTGIITRSALWPRKPDDH